MGWAERAMTGPVSLCLLQHVTYVLLVMTVKLEGLRYPRAYAILKSSDTVVSGGVEKHSTVER